MAPVIVQPTGQFHDDIIVALLGVPEHVLDDSAAFYSRYDVLDDHAYAGNEPVTFLILVRKLAVARLLLRLVYRDICQFMPLEAGVPIKVDAIGEHRPLFVAYFLVVLFALVGRAQVFDLPVFQTADNVVFQSVAFFLPL